MIADLQMHIFASSEFQHHLQKIKEVEVFLQSLGIVGETRTQIEQFHQFNFHIKNGRQLINAPELNEHLLPQSIVKDIMYMQYKDVLQPVFKDYKSDNLIIELAFVITYKIFMPKDFIVLKGEEGDEMYFIIEGQVQVLDGDKSTILATMKEGMSFGEIALFMQIKRTANVQAKTLCVISILTKKDLDRIMLNFPSLRLMFQLKAEKTFQSQREIRDKKSQLALHREQDSIEGSFEQIIHFASNEVTNYSQNKQREEIASDNNNQERNVVIEVENLSVESSFVSDLSLSVKDPTPPVEDSLLHQIAQPSRLFEQQKTRNSGFPFIGADRSSIENENRIGKDSRQFEQFEELLQQHILDDSTEKRVTTLYLQNELQVRHPQESNPSKQELSSPRNNRGNNLVEFDHMLSNDLKQMKSPQLTEENEVLAFETKGRALLDSQPQIILEFSDKEEQKSSDLIDIQQNRSALLEDSFPRHRNDMLLQTPRSRTRFQDAHVTHSSLNETNKDGGDHSTSRISTQQNDIELYNQAVEDAKNQQNTHANQKAKPLNLEQPSEEERKTLIMFKQAMETYGLQDAKANQLENKYTSVRMKNGDKPARRLSQIQVVGSVLRLD
ncbi:hypothetical protein FGO68_gene3598 [Halteria grandinella]|uniref:Cyclic nucleotide-binding domain-containing protein n=1 Tax=Halteria grandinella TaxID=5974 RepID=A0A8J8NEJ6_HALGN|nr:hypothetical protein FGO68_gene3598 [Halteria grandinella]